MVTLTDLRFGILQQIIKTKKCIIKRKLKFENHKNCLKANQLHNKIKHLEKNKINIDSLKKIIINS